MTVVEFFKYTFLGRLNQPQRIVDVAELEVETSGSKTSSPIVVEQTRSKIILIANWIAAIACVTSLVIVFV